MLSPEQALEDREDAFAALIAAHYCDLPASRHLPEKNIQTPCKKRKLVPQSVTRTKKNLQTSCNKTKHSLNTAAACTAKCQENEIISSPPLNSEAAFCTITCQQNEFISPQPPKHPEATCIAFRSDEMCGKRR